MYATLTYKGQGLSRPKAIRDALNLKPGDRLDFFLEQNGELRVTRHLQGRMDPILRASARNHTTSSRMTLLIEGRCTTQSQGYVSYRF